MKTIINGIFAFALFAPHSFAETLSMAQVREQVNHSELPINLVDERISNLPESTGENLKGTPPIWKEVNLSNSGKGWQSWTGKTKMILLNGELYPAATIQKNIGSNCTVYVRANKVYGCFYQKAAVNKTSWQLIGVCSFWNRGGDGWSAPQFRGTVPPCDPLVSLIGKNGQNYAPTKTNSKYKAILESRAPIAQNAYVFIFHVYKKVTKTTPGQIVDGRVKSLAVLVEK